jgi:alkanesulfonate monooxygenase SsuD/methylene tetrahydromethanopterin reductase-like flavin-dependent oxidoreductase (luciferase family)
VPDYCLELYLAAGSPAALEEAVERARAAAESFGARGRYVRYLRSTYLAEDETCLHFFAAASGEDVAEAAGQAGLTGHRITRSIDADQTSRCARDVRRAPTEKGVT